MLVRNETGLESMIHICKGVSHKVATTNTIDRPTIYIHDVHAHMVINKDIIFIRFCPYCGVNIDNDR